MMVDSHAHLDMAEFDADRDEVISRAVDSGVGVIINMGTDRPSSQASLALAHKYPGLFAAVGLHPNDITTADEDLEWVGELAGDGRVVAIGEIGLDFYRKKASREHQLECFRRQLELAAGLDMPVVIHCREADRELFSVLEEWVKLHNRRGELGVMHRFSGDAALAERYIELGFLVSLAGPVTFKNAFDAAEVARSVPLYKLLVETDCPFLAPQRYRGKRNEPAYVSLVVERIAELRGVPVEIVARATALNAARLFRLPN
jgi:TatD DNase family protein